MPAGASLNFIAHEAADVCVEVIEKAEAEAEELIEKAEAEAEELCQEAEAEAGELCQEVICTEEHAFKNIKKSLAGDDKQKTLTSHHIVETAWFNSAIIMMTLMNTMQMGLEADYPDWTNAWMISENFFTAGFFLEMVMKLCTYKFNYFRDAANWLDGSLTTLGVLDCWVLAAISGEGGVELQSLSVLRILRLLRLARVLKLMRSVKPLLLVIRGVVKAMSTAVYVFALCIFIFYVFAIFVTEHLGRVDEDMYPGFSASAEVIDEQEFMVNYNPHICFGSMIDSMLTLFNMAVLAEWAEIVRPIAVKQPLYLPVFLFFATCVGFGVMNVLIAVIVDVVTAESRKIETDYHEHVKKEKLKTLDQIQKMLADIDKDGDGSINKEELLGAMENSEQLRKLMEAIDLPRGWAADELLDMLDNNSDGVLQYGEFATSFFRLMDSDDFQEICIMQASINQVKHSIKDQGEQVKKWQSGVAADLAAIKGALGIATDLETQPKGKAPEFGAAVEEQYHCPAKIFSGPCSKSSKQDNNAIHEVAVNGGADITDKKLVGPTCDVSRQPVGMSELTLSTQMQESLDAALKVLRECISKEFISISTSLPSEIGCLSPKEDESRRQSCSSFAEDVDTQSPCPAEHLSEPTELKKGLPNIIVRSVNDLECVVCLKWCSLRRGGWRTSL